MVWEIVRIEHEWLNGLKLEAAIRSKPPAITSVPSLLHYILCEFGVKRLDDEQLASEAKRLGVEIQ